MKKTAIILLATILLISGCVVQKPRAELKFAQLTFLRTVNTLTILRDDDRFSDEDVEKIKAVISTGDRLLDSWTEAVIANAPLPNAFDTFSLIFEELIEYKIKGEKDVQ